MGRVRPRGQVRPDRPRPAGRLSRQRRTNACCLCVLFQGEDKAPGRGDSAAEDTAAPRLWKALSTPGGLQGAARADAQQLLRHF